MVAHDLVTTAVAGTEYPISDFTTIVDYCNTIGIAVRTPEQVLAGV